MAKEEAKNLFESLTDDQRKEILDFMKMPRFVREWRMFMEKVWWIPWVLSISALIVAVLVK